MDVADKNIHQLMDDLYALTARLQGFEQKYGLLSPDFYALYQAGQLDTGDNLRDVTLWAGAYEMKLKLEQTIHQLSQQRLEQLRAKSHEAEVRLVPDESAA
jgi:hypothetical protein